MVGIAQMVRASDCGPEGRGFDSHFPPLQCKDLDGNIGILFCFLVCECAERHKNTKLKGEAKEKKEALFPAFPFFLLVLCCQGRQQRLNFHYS